MLKGRVLDLFARSTEAFAFGTLSERLANLTGLLAWWAVFAIGTCRWTLRITVLIRWNGSAGMVEPRTSRRVTCVDVLLVDLDPTRRSWVAISRLLANSHFHLVYRIGNVHMSLIVNHMLLQTCWMSQWNVRRSR